MLPLVQSVPDWDVNKINTVETKFAKPGDSYAAVVSSSGALAQVHHSCVTPNSIYTLYGRLQLCAVKVFFGLRSDLRHFERLPKGLVST